MDSVAQQKLKRCWNSLYVTVYMISFPDQGGKLEMKYAVVVCVS